MVRTSRDCARIRSARLIAKGLAINPLTALTQAEHMASEQQGVDARRPWQYANVYRLMVSRGLGYTVTAVSGMLTRRKGIVMVTRTLKVRLARRIPDPIFHGAHRHILLCPVEALPSDLPLEKS